ncbi:hypothetical protein MMC08_007352 [Hypocenomyce scalaris]|nr:hypothetical protein [Hypocenomyce scalaris]
MESIPGMTNVDRYRHMWELILNQYTRFNTSVDQATWDDAEKKWKVDVQVSNGKDSEYASAYTISCDHLLSAVGQLNVPQYPAIAGLDSFTGKKMHSARWDWSYDLKDKRVALIGNGATAAQIAPEIAKVAKSLTIFQRTPNWIIPRLDAPISDFRRALYRYVPPIRHRYRAGMMDYRETFYAGVADPNSDFEKLLESMSQDMMKQQLKDKPELWPKLTPNYPTGCKRVIISDDFYPIFNLPNVTLSTTPITSITPTGIQTADESHDVDLIILATGFRTVEFMYPIRIFGQNGQSIEEIWKGGAKAFYGVTVPGLPNFGMLYGPNTNLGHNSIILMIEAQSRYLNQLIRVVLDARKRGQSLSLTPKPARVDAYNAELQSVLRTSTFAHPNCQSWYKTAEGLVTNNWSGTVVAYQNLLSRIDWTDYDVDGSGSGLVSAKPPTNIGRVVEEGQTSLVSLLLQSTAVVGAVAAALLWRNQAVVARLMGRGRA